MSTEDIEFKYKTLRLAVLSMREKQRLYFRTRSASSLRESKDLEDRVDVMLQDTISRGT